MNHHYRDPLENTPPIVGSGNFLADMGHADPNELRLKALLANQIELVMEDRGLTQAEVSEITGLAQPDVSRIVNANLRNYSVWRLMSALRALGQRIVLTVEAPDGGSEPIQIPI